MILKMEMCQKNSWYLKRFIKKFGVIYLCFLVLRFMKNFFHLFKFLLIRTVKLEPPCHFLVELLILKGLKSLRKKYLSLK